MIDPADLRDVFDRAASLPPQDRPAFLGQACGDNRIERLLAGDGRAGSVFDSDAVDSQAAGVRRGAAQRTGRLDQRSTLSSIQMLPAAVRMVVTMRAAETLTFMKSTRGEIMKPGDSKCVT